MYSILLQIIFHEYLNKNLKINTSFVSPGLRHLGSNKTGFNLRFIIFIFSCPLKAAYDTMQLYLFITLYA
jgi:hypothetical protein